MSLNSGSNASYVEMDSNHFTITTLAPRSSATRAQGGTILMRFCETIAQ